MAEIKTPCGAAILVDDADAWWLSQWSWLRLGNVRKGFYAMRVLYVNGKRTHTQMHRLITGAKDGEMIDHVNGNGLDNRRCNLRLASPTQNRANLNRPYSASGFKGVTLNKACRKWQAQIGCEGKQHYLGLFIDPKDAARAYDTAALSLFGEFAKTNEMLGLLGGSK